MKVLALADGADLWQVVAAVAIAQNGSVDEPVRLFGASAYRELLQRTGIGEGEAPYRHIRFDGTGDNFLAEAAEAVNCPLRAVPATFAERVFGIAPQQAIQRCYLGIRAASVRDDGPIVLCPETFRDDLRLPVEVWKWIVRLLRAYGRVVFLGEPGHRFDSAMFSENDIVTDATLAEKIDLLATARLIVGVPNAWTWMATAWPKRLLYLYPDDLPPARWFPWVGTTFGRVEYPRGLDVPVLLAGVRCLVNRLVRQGSVSA